MKSGKHGREVRTIEEWVRRGIAEGWCRQAPSHDAPGRFRRKFVADLSMNCEDPITVDVWGRYDRKGRQVTAIFVDIITRCRQCENCLKNKARMWTARACTEYVRAPATYMMTLTVRPEMHYFFDARMQQPLYRGTKMVRDAVGPLHGLAPATLFKLRAREIGYEVTDMLKRIRKRAPYRYLLVAERHGGNEHSEVFGRPHFHLLMHEKYASPALILPDDWQIHKGPCEAGCKHRSGKPLLHKVDGEVHDHAFVRTQWPYGYTKVVRCMDLKSAVYVCKYVSKDPMARVRASIGYGDEPSQKTHLVGTAA